MAAKEELDDFEFNTKKETYKDYFRCSHCRYNCLINVVEWDNLCMKDKWADGPCNKFEPDNRLSLYIKSFKWQSYDDWSKIADLLTDFDVAHLLDDETLTDKAIAIHKIIDD